MIQRENENIEFKKSTSELKEAVISLSSMLNKSGHGIVYFGVKNDGTVCGQEVGDYTTTRIVEEIRHNIVPSVSPKVEVLDEGGKSVIAVEVIGEDTPYCAYGRYYKRSDDQDNQMTQLELQHYFQNKHFTYSDWEEKLTPYGEEAVDEELLIRYIDEANEVNRLDYRYESIAVTMTKLGLMKDGKLNNAGFYLFSNKRPLLVKMARYTTDEMLSFIDNRQFSGNIFECINQSLNYILSAININAVIEGLQRVEKPEIPIAALRETVINSFVHMRVVDGEYNEITISPSYVRIYNPGMIAFNESPEAFAAGRIGSKLRNPLIAMTLYRNKTIEAFGTGFRRIYSVCNRERVEWTYRTEGLGVAFIFKRGETSILRDSDKNEPDKDVRRPEEGLSDTEKLVLNAIRNKEKLERICDASEELHKSAATIQRAIAGLVAKGLVEREGSKKDGFWRIRETS